MTIKRACVSRYGAIGDQVMITPVLRQLKKDGYHITVNVSEMGTKVLLHNPNIDRWLIHNTDSIPMDELPKHWESMSKNYDKFVNLSGVVEQSLLKHPKQSEYYLPKEERHEICNKNYIDHHMEIAGYPEIKGELPELFFTKEEHNWAKKMRRKYLGKYWVLWSLAGSSYHKAYPFTEYVATEFLDNHPDAVMWTVGDNLCKVWEWDHPRTKCMSGELDIRKSMLLCQYVDVVIGTETGVLNAASCWDTPKIIILSHSSEENLSKYWINVINLHADVQCYPCHQLHYEAGSCPSNKMMAEIPICMSGLGGKRVLNSMEILYNEKKRTGRDLVVTT